MYNMSVQKQENLNNDNDDNKDKDSSENSLTAAQDKIKLEWSPENENILVEWCDFAQCYKWLNSLVLMQNIPTGMHGLLFLRLYFQLLVVLHLLLRVVYQKTIKNSLL